MEAKGRTPGHLFTPIGLGSRMCMICDMRPETHPATLPPALSETAHCSDPDRNETASLKERDLDAAACGDPPPSTIRPLPSETAKDERIRALERALAQADFALGEIGRGRAGATSAVCGERAQHAAFEINRVLHPHQSWCRTEHEGACIPESIDEVAAASEDE